MKFTDITKHFQGTVYEKHVDIIESGAERCVGFHMIPTEEGGLPVGCSKVGGSPDLPLECGWPSCGGRPLNFLLQINLEDISKFSYCKELPQTGLLSVFFDAVEQRWGFDPQDQGRWQILYVEAPDSGLKRLTQPHSDLPVREFRPCALTFYEALSPGWETVPVHALNMDDHEADEFFDFAHSLPGGPAHQILGHPLGIQSFEKDMQFRCQCVSNGLYMGGGPAFDAERAKELEPGAAEWRLLLQIDSDDSSAMEWGDSGRLYFWIRDQNLRQRDFSAVWMILDCV